VTIQTARTNILEIAYEQGGPVDGPPLFLLHGWPDDVRAWRGVAPFLHASGYRTIAPYLRGFGPTKFLSPDTVRDGRGVALAQDAIDLADALELETFSVIGHDWGARAAYSLAALFPERVERIVALALAFQPRGGFTVPSFSQSRRFWYQWFMTIDGGAEKVREQPKDFARIQWDTWSPSGWFDEEEFAATARSFENPDWPAITLHGYRSRWQNEICDPRYDDLQRRLTQIETIEVPTLMIQGGSDFCDDPASSEGFERYFTASYQRLLLPGVGHFPTREAPQAVADAILRHMS
jgi:pimeloyl-ACP methyl ester carboxylesterase